MQGRSVLSFLSTKKNPAPAGDEDGRMMPAARDDEREAMSQYIKSSLGGEELGGGGREVALALLKTSWRSREQAGTLEWTR